MAKIGRNEPCPCGSGKKYKNCCGKTGNSVSSAINVEEIRKSDLNLVDFVIENLSDDAMFLATALQMIIGPFGNKFCKENKELIEKSYENDELRSFVKNDLMGVYAESKKESYRKLYNVRPYSGVVPKEVKDLCALYKEGHIEITQVVLFHAYLLDNLRKRFSDYLYVPSDKKIMGQKFGGFAHRGFDFLIALTLYLELQLGVHVFFDWVYPLNKSDKMATLKYFNLLPSYIMDKNTFSRGIIALLYGYADVIPEVQKEYNSIDEVELYHSIGAYKGNEYNDIKKGIKWRHSLIPDGFNYVEYLKMLIAAICFNNDSAYIYAGSSFPQCDFIKYTLAIEGLYEVFEEKKTTIELNASNNKALNVYLDSLEMQGATVRDRNETYFMDKKETYHSLVFNMMDELNGFMNHQFPVGQMTYEDFGDIHDNDFTISKNNNCMNPARKNTDPNNTVRKLRMELYNLFNGKFFVLEDSEEPGDMANMEVVGKYPMLPWVSNGKEPTVHITPFDRSPGTVQELYDTDIRKRQEFLSMEYRVSTIPVNCIEEYLNPDVYYNWDERNDLLLETEQQNAALKKLNASLERHIQLNQELVKNLSHSSANYLNSDRLATTGINLHNADGTNPTVDKLHDDGLFLMLQSEQEMFLSRSLNSLVWRCSADTGALSDQIRGGLSKSEGVGVEAPVEFAMKMLISRVLFRDEDQRAKFIRRKLKKSDEEILLMKSSFMLDILAPDKSAEGAVIDWWNNNICGINIIKSNRWEKLKIIKEKAFYDLITEIVSEQLLNALSHGALEKEITLEFGQAEELKGIPKWTYVSCRNESGEKYEGGRGVGISSLNETMLLINSGKRGLETRDTGSFESKVWILAQLTKAK